MSKFKILIADAHTLTREGLKALLSRRKDLSVVGEAKSSKELREKIKKGRPDVIIIDFDIPGYFSINDIAFLREQHPQVSVLVISANQSKQDIIDVLDYGVSSYLLKECDEDEILSAVYASAKKQKFFCGRVMDTILEKVMHQCPDGVVCHHCQPVSLSGRELEVIKLIAGGYTTKDIAGKLVLSFHTISTHRKNIFRKLAIRNSSELILYAFKKGIIASVKRD